jgi:hypothetical protein
MTVLGLLKIPGTLFGLDAPIFLWIAAAGLVVMALNVPWRSRRAGSGMDEEKMKRALDTVDCLARNLREGWKTVADQQRHQDSMVVWIVGLASAAVVGLPPMYNYVQDLKSAPRWVLAFPIVFFVLAVLSGIVVRLLLEKLMQDDALAASMKIVGWEALRFKHSEDEEGRKRLLNEALEILEDRSSKSGTKAKSGHTQPMYKTA